MIRCLLPVLAVLLELGTCAATAESNDVPLVQRRWFETRTAHFNIYSCGAPQNVYKLSARLEQFCQAYTLLAGAQAVASPPIVVMAFPDHEIMKPFLPLYQGQPANLAAFFQRGSDENLIVLALPGTNSAFTDMEVIFHEYTHLLFRHNDRVWPLWLKEGMAEVYSTFETTGYNARIGNPIGHHLRLLAQQPLMPLAELFAVTHDSPQYNERDRQGIFYAESWLLTHFLMAGDNPAYKARFGQFTRLLRAGPVSRTSLHQRVASLPAGGGSRTSPLSPAGPVCADRTGLADGRFLTHNPDHAQHHPRGELISDWATNCSGFTVPTPLNCILRRRKNSRPPVPCLTRDWACSLPNGNSTMPPCAICRRRSNAVRPVSWPIMFMPGKNTGSRRMPQDRYAPLKNEAAAEIRGELQKSLALMPDFGPAHELLGFFEMVQGENLALAEQHLQRAIQLEPENPSYLFSLAQVQLRDHNLDAARHTLQPLLLPNVDAKLRAHAEEMIQGIARNHPVY